MGFLWAIYIFTHEGVYEHKGGRCIHLLDVAWEEYEEFADTTFCCNDDDRLTCWMYG